MRTRLLFYLTLLIGLNVSAQINVSTGVDASGNSLPAGSTDPFWTITGGPLVGQPATVSPTFLAADWENTPVPVTNAGLLNFSGFCCDNVAGLFLYERSFNVVSGTARLSCNFSVASADYLDRFELVKPDLTTIPLTAVYPTWESLLSNPITDVIVNPMPGAWKIRAKVLFLDNSGFFLLSGYINDGCQSLYVDADADGYTNGTVIDCSGTVPTGYSLTSLGVDCDDTNANVNPNHVEVPANGIDDNCNGVIDEITPPVRVITSQCGTTLASLWNTIFSTQNINATSYRFEISNGSYIQTYDTSGTLLYQCNMYNFPGVTYGTTYAIRVAVKVGGFWQAYGPSCNITTPAGLTTSLVPQSCGISVSSSWNSLFVNPVSATRYRVKVVSQSGIISYLLLTPPTTMFNLRNPGFVPLVPLTANSSYTISVQVELNGLWQMTSGGQDLYGTSCTIFTSPLYQRFSESITDVSDFKVMAYPNPYNDDFNLDITSVDENSFDITIYDMMGRLIDSYQATASGVGITAFGKKYASGVYNVIVSQGERVKTLRVIKR